MILRASASAAGLALVLTCAPAFADKIKHPTAVFAGLDKITGRIISFEVATDETVQFGSLQVTPRVCYTRPQTEAPQTDGFVEVEEVTSNNEFKKIFSGWMFAASPGLHGVEHAVYDVWLTDCKGGSEVIRDVVSLPAEDETAPVGPANPAAPARRQQPSARTNPPPAPVGNPQPRQQTTGSLPQPGGALPPPGSLIPPPPPAQAPRVREGGLVPPGNIPNVPAQAAPRRAPSQTFFPTRSGDSLLDR